MDPQVITIVVAIAGATGTILSFFLGKRERAASAQAKEASATADISESFKKLVDSLEERVICLEDDKVAMQQSYALELGRIKLENQEIKIEIQEKYRVEVARIKLENQELKAENAQLRITNTDLQRRIEVLEAWKENQIYQRGLTSDDTK